MYVLVLDMYLDYKVPVISILVVMNVMQLVSFDHIAFIIYNIKTRCLESYDFGHVWPPDIADYSEIT